jgi:hypothetical protein
LCECARVNPYAADPGEVVKHLVLTELLHVGRRRITTHIDTHSGRPRNELSLRGYAFADADREQMRGSEMKGWLRVDAESVSAKRGLEPRAMQSFALARALPPEEKK